MSGATTHERGELISYKDYQKVVDFMKDLAHGNIKIPRGSLVEDFFIDYGCGYGHCSQEFFYKGDIKNKITISVDFSKQSNLTGIIRGRKVPTLDKKSYEYYEIFIHGTPVAKNNVGSYNPKVVRIEIRGNDMDEIYKKLWNYIAK